VWESKKEALPHPVHHAMFPLFPPQPSKVKGRWQRHTLPLRYQSSTICAGGLNFWVRDGTRCTPAALATNNPSISARARTPIYGAHWFRKDTIAGVPTTFAWRPVDASFFDSPRLAHGQHSPIFEFFTPHGAYFSHSHHVFTLTEQRPALDNRKDV
jgi:hypothetical protein